MSRTSFAQTLRATTRQRNKPATNANTTAGIANRATNPRISVRDVAPLSSRARTNALELRKYRKANIRTGALIRRPIREPRDTLNKTISAEAANMANAARFRNVRRVSRLPLCQWTTWKGFEGQAESQPAHGDGVANGATKMLGRWKSVSVTAQPLAMARSAGVVNRPSGKLSRR